MVRRWYIRSNEASVEEVRERLNAGSLLGQRWREWWDCRRHRRNVAPPLEPLDPTSARARYREMLQAITTARGDLARYPAETPTEYEARLLTHLRREVVGSTDLASQDDLPGNSAILDELTHAYVLERYGGKRTDNPHRAFLQAWVPRLIARLTGRSIYKTKGMMGK